MRKLSLTTTALAAIAGSALLAGVALASDAMRSNDVAGGNAISTLARSTDAKGEAKGDLISAAAKAMNDRAADVDKDKNEDVDNDVDNENDEDVDNDVENDENETADADRHGDAVAAVARTNDRHDEHSHRGR